MTKQNNTRKLADITYVHREVLFWWSQTRKRSQKIKCFLDMDSLASDNTTKISLEDLITQDY